jgi:capsular exopolysaccharide synthesis family protein
VKESRFQAAGALTDQYEVLKHRVLSLLNGKSDSSYVLAFTSCEIGEGVTNVSANFALAVAKDSGRRVLLMDGHLREPSLHNLFLDHLSRDAASGKVEAGKEVDMPAWKVVSPSKNLDTLLARRPHPNAGPIFERSEFAEFLEQARRRYNLIVIDCPPVQSTGNAIMIASKADGLVLVVEAGRVRRQVLQRTIAVLEDSGTNILGVVLNKRKYPIPRIVYDRL